MNDGLPVDNLDQSELLTIAEAAARIGVTERALRRRLARPEYAAATQTVTRQTRTGTRTAAGLPPHLVEALRADFEIGTNAAEHGNHKAAQDGANAAQDGGTQQENAATAGALPAALYQKIIADKDAEIEYLRGQLNQAQHNLAREQMLRAMPELTAGAASEASHSGQEDEEQKDEEAEGHPRGEKHGWWARLWKV